MRIVGLMSGTSMDGIDAALVDLGTEPFRWELLAFAETPYDDRQRALLSAAVEGRAGAEALCELHAALGSWLARAVRRVCEKARLDPGRVDLVGSHGHTVWHRPPEPGRKGASLQLGDPAVLAEETGLPVVSDFRSQDLAAGGQGAPLVPFADALLFRHGARARAIQNLGGMANVTLLPPEGAAQEILAFDTGPGVALLDVAAELATDGRLRFDRDGALAREGRPDPALLDRLMADPFFSRRPPRSTGRERFGAPMVRALAEERGLEPGGDRAGWAELLATLVRFTARSIGEAYRGWVVPRGVDEVFLTGGGARNPELVRAVEEELEPLPVRPGGELGLDPDAREAVAFAVLAWAHVEGIPGNVPVATGASGPRVLGSRTPAPASRAVGRSSAARFRPGPTGAERTEDRP